MFRSEDMRLATVFALKEDRTAVFTALQEAEILQLKEITDKTATELLSRNPPVDELKATSDVLVRISRLINICKLAKVKLPFPQEMFGLDILNKRKVTGTDSKEGLNQAKDLLKKIEEPLLKLEETHSQSIEELEEKKQLAKTIEVVTKHGLDPLLLKNTNNISIVSGTIPSLNLAKLELDIEEETEGYGFLVSKELGPKESIIIVATLTEHAPKMNFLLKKHGVAQFVIPELPKVKDLSKWLKAKIKSTEETITESLKAIKKYRQKHFDNLIVAREQIEILKHRVEAMHKIHTGNSFFIAQGWVPKSSVIELSKVLFEITNGHVIVDYEVAKEKDEPPVKLTNPGWLKPFEVLTELYALPKYKDLDPTFIVGPIFLIFAGFMLTDFVYGLGLVLLGLTMIFYFSKYSPGIKDIAVSITGIGAFSMFFGVLTGSYLGDSMVYFIGKTSEQLALWKDPLTDPLYFLLISLGVALIHLNVALVLGLLEDIRKKDYHEMIKSRIVWWILQLSILLWYTGWSTLAGKVLLGVAVAIVIKYEGALGLLGMTGFMGDAISYSRLFALALSTAGIAMTVNLLADLMYGVPYVGFLLAAIVFIVGHLFSFLMNALGAFVHSIRLQFVEFFGKFYEGGGDKFEPFKEERYYTEVEQ